MKKLLLILIPLLMVLSCDLGDSKKDDEKKTQAYEGTWEHIDALGNKFILKLSSDSFSITDFVNHAGTVTELTDNTFKVYTTTVQGVPFETLKASAPGMPRPYDNEVWTWSVTNDKLTIDSTNNESDRSYSRQ